MIPKFRAWDLIDNRMRYDIGVIEFNGIDKNISAISFNYALDDTGYGEVDNSHSEYYDANCFELMQSTGLKDKNGTEIYEGDIVQHSEKPNPCFSYPFEVVQARTGEWRLDNFRCGTVLAFSNQDELEVLGNIYETPELLEDN